MTAYSEDDVALAAEYALGTLDVDERAQVETMMSADKDFTALVETWVFRLGVLNQMVGSVEPRPEVWDRIKTAIGASGPQAPLSLPEAPPPAPEIAASEPQASESQASESPAAPELKASEFLSPELLKLRVPTPRILASGVLAPVVAASNPSVIRLSRQVWRWRGIAGFATAVAAALAALIAVGASEPDLLPDAIRPKARTQMVEVRSPPTVAPPSAQYVALLQKEGGLPAFILTVDAATRNLTIRKLGAQPEPGKSFELWLISDKLPKPRSLGVIGSGDFTARPVLAAYDADLVNDATYAVTVEPAGGSPDGGPHSTPVYAGKLIETVPPAATRGR